jgi:LCP family protein required for cell wall assembly
MRTQSRWGRSRSARRRSRHSRPGCTFLIVLSALSLVVMCVTGWLAWSALNPRSLSRTVGGLGVGSEFNEYPHWEGQERVNILILGVDQRGQARGPWRTDTMIVVSVDPLNKSAGLLSIPRDLWVEIPPYGQNRINTAYVSGEVNAYPGGGPALAKKTVQYNLGEPIHYYVRLNFTAAEQLVDLVEGVDVYVEHAIDDPTYPDEAYGYDPLFIPAGWQHLDGKLALKYSRSRHGSSDFDRAHRQQQVILALRAKMTAPDVLAGLLPRAGTLAATLESAVQSDLTLDQVIRLARLAADIDPSRIRSAVIDSTMTQNWTTPQGAQVLIPNRERMSSLHASIFSSPPPDTEVARIAVYNGTSRSQLAAHCAERLQAQGFQVAQVGSAPGRDQAPTLILVYTDKWTTARALADALRVPAGAVSPGGSPDGAYDIKVVLGADYQPE